MTYVLQQFLVPENNKGCYLKGTIHIDRRHFLGGGGVKNWPNLLTDSGKKLPTGVG